MKLTKVENGQTFELTEEAANKLLKGCVIVESDVVNGKFRCADKDGDFHTVTFEVYGWEGEMAVDIDGFSGDVHD